MFNIMLCINFCCRYEATVCSAANSSWKASTSCESLLRLTIQLFKQNSGFLLAHSQGDLALFAV